MEKTFDAVFLLIAFSILCVLLPLKWVNEETKLIQQTQAEYEADYLAWEIKNYQRLDSSVLPDKTIQFYCYNDNMELVTILTSQSFYDFSPYHCVIFSYKDIKEGVCLAS